MIRLSRFLQNISETTTQLFHIQILQKSGSGQARPCEGRTGAGSVCMTLCVGRVVCWVEGVNCLKAVILTAADISRLEELGGEQD